ncbi:MAG: MogA/MoaB family molybdenum cofactor biosynthesis protein [Spirochaetaceae bacterium]|jgi:molybdenum cofactor synthesis domain-containing protein|nr:MogA/MoaB family molybdenum cofactor biosynthesis protein [Spirochaetaceae bacterium]
MEYTAIILTVSDRGFRGERLDTAGPAVRAILEGAGFAVIGTAILPDEAAQISAALIHAADTCGANLVLTVGGTGFAPRDVTPEATAAVCERLTPGIPEAMRAASMAVTNRGMLSRGQAGIRRRTLIVNLPGSEKAARESLPAVLDGLPHGLDVLLGRGDHCT